MFRAGRKVMCINARFPPEVWEWCDDVPEAGRVYTIRLAGITHDYHTGDASLGLCLIEVRNPVFAGGREASFCARRFRALTEAESAEFAAESRLAAV